MGAAAVNSLIEGQRGFMVGYVNGKIVTPPMSTAWEEKRLLNAEMMELVDCLSI
jgi:6-phosphofructokinase 1